jgi:hypothetical protein
MSTEAAESKDVDMADVATTETTEEVSKHTRYIVVVVAVPVGRTLCYTVNTMQLNAIA